MRVEHQHMASVTINGVTYNSPEWHVERLVFDYHVAEVTASLFINDGVHVDLIDIELTLSALTESNVILAIENYLEGNT